jgi:hypothetical protein
MTKDYDKIAIISKGLLGAVPIVGPMMAEVAGSLIPNQRIDRIEAFLKILEAKIDEQDREKFQERFSHIENIDLIEDSFIQASRALSDERKHYVASLLKNSLINSSIEYIEGKRLLSILSNLNDIEILMLKSHENNTYDGNDSFWEKHKNVLQGPSVSLGSSEEELDKHAIFETHKRNLTNLGLLTPRFKNLKKGEIPEFDSKTGMMKSQGHQTTLLGRLLLKRLEINE